MVVVSCGEWCLKFEVATPDPRSDDNNNGPSTVIIVF